MLYYNELLCTYYFECVWVSNRITLITYYCKSVFGYDVMHPRLFVYICEGLGFIKKHTYKNGQEMNEYF